MKTYFKISELNPKAHPMSPEHQANLKELIRRLSLIREAYGRPMTVTSGYRSREDQEKIYHNATKIPYGSAHMSGEAVDVWDRDKNLAAFVCANIPLLEKVGLWCEDVIVTRNWVHFQSRPPKSGSRFFKP